MTISPSEPLPPRAVARQHNDQARKILRALEPGASQFFAMPAGLKLNNWQSALAVLSNRLFGPRQVTTAQRVEAGVTGVRVWRLEQKETAA